LRRTGVLVGLVAVLMAATVLLSGRFHRRHEAAPAPLPDIALRRTDGSAVSLASFRGRWTLVYFGYTHCRGACTEPLAGMAEAARARGDVAAVFVTLDPGRDTASALQGFVHPFAPPVVALTGDANAIAAAERVFGVYAVPRPADGGVHYDRSNLIYVVDPSGHLAGHVDGLAPATVISSSIGKPVP
jgi:protein SCO1